MDGGTYGSVKSICNLVDTLDGDGVADIAATVRLRKGMLQSREIMQFLTSIAPTLDMEERV